MTRFFHGKCFTLLALATILCLESASGRDWKILRQDGRDYVTSDNMKNFFGFTAHKKNPDEAKEELFHPKMRFALFYGEDDSHLTFNGIRFNVHSPLVWSEEQNLLLVSTRDLTHVVDPIARPSKNAFLPEKPEYFLKINCPENTQSEELLKQLKHLTASSPFNITNEKGDEQIEVVLALVENPEKNENSVSTVWHRENTQLWPSGRKTLAISTATALHASLVHELKQNDRGISPATLNFLKPRVEITINHSVDNIFLSRVAGAVVKGLERLTEAAGKKADEPISHSPVGSED